MAIEEDCTFSCCQWWTGVWPFLLATFLSSHVALQLAVGVATMEGRVVVREGTNWLKDKEF